jgi:hypothetical protein
MVFTGRWAGSGMYHSIKGVYSAEPRGFVNGFLAHRMEVTGN